ncbi:lactonase family protein [Paenibacillus senegalensis]|uniref:lactonase family protein n=1 Tax=Paenibacillus senegalensis TaxID=1465766 RepID=UPI000287EF54|nr:lactonase family protein [Paenibacillus senegalensis]
MTTEKRMLVFIGSYSEEKDNSVHVYALDEKTGALSLLDQVSGLQNPTFLSLDTDNARLYSIAERRSEQGERMGAAVSFEIDPRAGTLKELNRAGTVDATTCHIKRDKHNRYVVVSSYGGGKVGLVSLTADGRIGQLLDVHEHQGSGPNKDRQEGPHPHSAWFSPDERFVFVPDLGIDRVQIYAIDEDKQKLVPHGSAELHPGAGPRHMAFHPSGRYAYVINELDSTVTAFQYDAQAGQLAYLAHYSTLPGDYKGESYCAEIQISPDGRYVYGSNRGHDSIAVYRIDEASGELAVVQFCSTYGEHPRHFSLSPDGKWLIAANRDTNNVVTYRVDQESGKLQPTGQQITVAKPVCIQMDYFPVR